LQEANSPDFAGALIALLLMYEVPENAGGFIPRLVNGRMLKAMNRWYNKRMKELKMCLPKD